MSATNSPASTPPDSPRASEYTPLVGEANSTFDKVRALGNVLLGAAAFTTGGALVYLRDKPLVVLLLTVAAAAETFGLLRANLSERNRRMVLWITASIIYELFLPLWTIAEANKQNRTVQYLPLLPFMLWVVCYMESLTEAGAVTRQRIVDPQPSPTDPPTDSRFGLYPVTAKRVSYAACQSPPIVAGIPLAVAGARMEAHTPDRAWELSQMVGYAGIGVGVGAVLSNTAAAVETAMIKRDRRHRVESSGATRSVIAINSILNQLALPGAAACIALANDFEIPALFLPAGIGLGWRWRTVQARIELEGMEPSPSSPSLDPSVRETAKRVVYIATAAFMVAFTTYVLIKMIQTNDGPTYGASAGMLAAVPLAYGAYKGVQYLWERPAHKRAIVWLLRLIQKFPEGLAVLAIMLDHAMKMKADAAPSVPLILAALTMTAGNIGLDLARAADLTRVIQDLCSPLATLAMVGFAESFLSHFGESPAKNGQ